MAHLKRYVMPKSWPLAVKEEKFVIRPMPGPHSLKKCLPLQVVLRNILGIAETAAEARQILNTRKVMIDKTVRTALKFPVGLMDVIEIPEIKKQYRVSINSKGLFLEEIKQSDADKKLCLITGKKTLRGGKEQLNLHDGNNIIIDKGKYNTMDSVVISLPDKKVVGHNKLEKGSPAFIFSGKNMGISGIITKVKTRSSMTEKSTVTIKSDKKEVETLKEYIFVGDPSSAGKVKK